MSKNQTNLSVISKKRSVLTSIASKKQKKRLSQNAQKIRDFILTSDSPFVAREAYKALRTNLIFSLPSRKCKKIIVTSALASEGKSTNCLNMAITFAEMDAKVLIIDCDLRRPNIAKLLNVPNAPGLSNLLVGLNDASEIIHESKYKNLSYMTSGDIPPNPVELLGSERMEALLKELEEDFDYIFIDSPPVNLVIDTVVISKYVNGIVMVVLQNSTDKEAMRHSLNQLEFAGAKVLGFLLNGVMLGKHKNRYYSGKKYGKGYYSSYRTNGYN